MKRRGMAEGRAFICSFTDAVGQVRVNGRVVRFDYSEEFGPLLIDKDGAPLDAQPVSERHAFWPAFDTWLAKYRKAPPLKPPPPAPDATIHLDTSAKGLRRG